MNNFRDRYYEKIGQMLDILEGEIATDADCLTHGSPEDDVKYNSHHYMNLLLHWQLAILQWEMDWETTDPHAAAEIATISEVHKMFLGAQGLTGWLENIAFQFTEDDQATMSRLLIEHRGEEQ
jgi:hypothetical protein